MNDKQPGFLVWLLRGIWRGIDLTRRVVLNAIFWLILILFVVSLSGGGVRLEPKTVLVIAPKGAIVEQYTLDPFARALNRFSGDEQKETQLRDILKGLELAAKDPNIERVLVVPDEINAAGSATLREVAGAIERFRKSGKEVIAYGDDLDQRGYFIAAHADRVFLNPEGGVFLTGIGRYRTYLKDLFDKIGVEARLFRVGEYKSAGETYVRSDQSPEAREADLYWMGDVWQRYLTEVAQQRKLDAAEIQKNVDGMVEQVTDAGGDLAQLALRQGLVDELKTRDQVRALLIHKGAEDRKRHTFRNIALDDYLTLARSREGIERGPEVAVVVAQGEIVNGDQPPGMVGGDSTAKLIRKAREDEDVKAVVLRVNSPGGVVFASELIRREVELTKQAGKPIVVSMGDLAASGGYWISMNADQIVANPSTITGSIGIFGLWFNVPKTMDKLGLHTDGVATSWLAGAFDPTRPYDPRLGELIQGYINHGYSQFIGKVAEARGRTPEEINQIARGRVWTGAQAKERGLVDKLGLFPDAIADAASRAKLGADYRVTYQEKELGAFENFVQNMSRSSLATMLAGAGIALPTSWLPAHTLGELDRLRQLVLAQQQGPGVRPALMLAHCQCGAD